MINVDSLLETPTILTTGRSYEQVLIDAKNVLLDEDHWTQFSYARNSVGLSVRPTSSDACSWCLLGAIARVSNEYGIIPPPLLSFLKGMVEYKFGAQFGGPGEMNDYVSHSVVLNFLDECIAQFNM